MYFRFRGVAMVLALALRAPAGSPPVYQLTTVAGSDLVGDGGPAAAAQVAQPEGIAVDPGGNVYIADAANHRVRKVTPAGTISTVAGNGHAGFSGDNGPAAAAQLNQPYDLALDAAGDLYIADYGNQRVRRIGTDGNITTVAGGGSVPLLGPRNVAIDAAGSVYVSEFDGHRVSRLAPDGTIATVAGVGIAGFGGDGGLATAAQMAYPAGLSLDGAGNLYIVDSFNARIRKVLAGAGTISTVCSQQTFGQPYVQLSGLAADPAGDLYITETANALVWRLTPAGALTRVAGTPGAGAYTGDGQSALLTGLSAPVAVALDAAGDLYISEARRVRMVAAATGIATTLAGVGVFGYSGDGGSALMAVLNSPAGLALQGGSLYIADTNNQRVREVAADGSIATVAGNGTASFAGDGLAAPAAGLDGPAALAFDPAGNLYIADSYNNRVRRVDPSGVIITFAGNGSVSGFGGDGDAAGLTPLNTPQGVAADPEGNVYIADTNHHRVMRVDSAGNVQTVAGTGTPGTDGLNGPTALALDGAGNLYIADTQNQRVQMLTPDGVISTVAGAAAALSYPAGVAVDGSGNLYIADTGHSRVLLIAPDGSIATIAGTGDANYNGDGGAALDIALNRPSGLAVDGQGNLWVADTGNNRVRILSPTQPVVTPPQLVPVTLASAASLLPGPLAPGEIFSIFGQGVGPDTAVEAVFDASGRLPATLGNVQVLFNGIAAPLFYAQAQQINAQVPYEMAGQASAQLQVLYQGFLVASTQVALADGNPALFTLHNGTGNLVVVNQDGTINSDQNPAARGSYVVLYATGEGQTTPGGVTGQPAQAPFPTPLLPVSLTMADVPASILFAGEAPGFVGLMQINVQVPSGFVPPGDLPVVLTVGPYQSQAGVTIAVE